MKKIQNKTEDEYKAIFREMIQHHLPFQKKARTNHRNDFEFFRKLFFYIWSRFIVKMPYSQIQCVLKNGGSRGENPVYI